MVHPHGQVLPDLLPPPTLAALRAEADALPSVRVDYSKHQAGLLTQGSWGSRRTP
jgi:hypothetical protein